MKSSTLTSPEVLADLKKKAAERDAEIAAKATKKATPTKRAKSTKNVIPTKRAKATSAEPLTKRVKPTSAKHNKAKESTPLI